jgi:hypothetical protein
MSSYHGQFLNVPPGEDELDIHENENEDIIPQQQAESKNLVVTNKKKFNIFSGIGGSKSRKHLSRKIKGKKSYKKKKYGKSKKCRRFRRSIRSRR